MKDLILVVEDEGDLRSDIEQILLLYDYNVVTAKNGFVGLEIARQKKPDLIISDVMMPEMDGFQMLEELSKEQHTASIPFLFLTARTSRQDVRRGMDLGANDYITKPFETLELVEAVRTRLKKEELVQQKINKRYDEIKLILSKSLPHEIRTPLNIIYGYTEMLKKNLSSIPTHSAIEMLETIHGECKRLERLFENHLYFSQMQAILYSTEEKNNYKKNQTSIPCFVIKELCTIYEYKNNINFDIAVCDSDYKLAISKVHYIKIITELIDNAVKFNQSNQNVMILTKCDDRNYKFEITNFGRFMTREQIKSVGAFSQFQREIFEQQGIGLGLAICFSIAQLYDLEIEIDSDEKSYTKVIITIPVKNR